MPSKTTAELLRDILDACDAIQEFVAGMTFAQYEADLKTTSAVERQFLIVAEASKRLGSRATQLCPKQDWRLIQDFGNVIRHDYDGVAHDIVWKSIRERIPALQADVTEALLNLNGTSSAPPPAFHTAPGSAPRSRSS